MPQPHSTHHAEITLDEHGVGTLTLRNAKSLNIVGAAAIAELTDALARLGHHPRLRVLVFRGSGDKAFIGGADINEMSALTPDTAAHFINALRRLCDACLHLPVPVISRLQGWCLGGGLEVAMACDLRIAGRSAQFGMPEVKVGIPSVIHAALMPRLIGAARAQWMLMLGDPIDAATAESWGLVHQVCDDDALDATIARLATPLAALGPAVVRQQKRLLRSWEGQPVATSIEASVAEFAGAFATGEPQQFMEAFKQRKKSAS